MVVTTNPSAITAIAMMGKYCAAKEGDDSIKNPETVF
jgi:hypothetical protein